MSAHAQRVTRDDIVHLGQSGKPWQFLPVGIAALQSLPDDLGLRFLLAANFAQLALRTPANEQLEAIIQAQPQARTNPDIIKLREALAALPDDRISQADAHSTAMRNLRALRANRPLVAQAVAPVIDRWSSRPVERFRAFDGHVVERHAGEWKLLADHRALATEFAARHLAHGASRLHKPIVVEGIRPPWLLQAAMKATPLTPIGYQPRVMLVQADALELLDGLAMTDLSHELTAPRLVCFVGSDASKALHHWLLEHRRAQIAGVVVTIPGTTPAASPTVSEAIHAVVRVQEDEHRAMKARVDALYAARDAGWWARRYEQARSGHAEPLRVLIPTSVYTTFVQHAADDLARAFRARGMQARLIKEHDRFEMLASTATLEAVDSFKPDLVVMINHTRRVPLGDLLPEQLPLVTWVQDSMPTMFEQVAARADGPMDFVVGHLLHTTLQALGAKCERTLAFPVVADQTKFHAGPIDAALLREHTCEVSSATHQSEPPEAMLPRWLDEQTDPKLRTIGEQVAQAVQALIDADEPRLLHRTKWVVIDAVEQACGTRDQAAINTIRYGLALPLADRLLRHRTMQWASEICIRRGWRLGLYGKGWEKHPTLSRWARGPADHGEQLRAVYQASRAHLHVSVNTLVHQRVLECALSGGLPLCLLGEAAVGCLRSRMFAELINQATPLHIDAQDRRHYALDATPLTRRFVEASTASGWPASETIWINRSLAERYEQNCVPVPPEQHDPVWLLGGPLGDAGGGLCELGFRTQAQLEQRLERAITHDHWRSEQSEAIACRVRSHLTHACMIDPVLNMIGSTLSASATQFPIRQGAA